MKFGSNVTSTANYDMAGHLVGSRAVRCFTTPDFQDRLVFLAVYSVGTVPRPFPVR